MAVGREPENEASDAPCRPFFFVWTNEPVLATSRVPARVFGVYGLRESMNV